MLMTPEVSYENTSVKSKTFYKIKRLYLLFVLKPYNQHFYSLIWYQLKVT